MTEAGRKYLSDIRQAIELIEEFTSNIDSFGAYENDAKTKSATERQLVIIGEALNKLIKVYPEIRIENIQLIISFRNRLVHSYDSIDNSIVWVIIKKYLPDLKGQLETLK